jgi:hypothetical protein
MTTLSSKPNLFRHATKELSQDAFLCWLLEWSDKSNASEDAGLHSAGLHLLNSLLELHGQKPVVGPDICIHKQLCHVDIVVEVNMDIVLMVEDKVHSREHDAQLSYRDCISHKYPGRNILPIYFKTGDQCDYARVESAGYLCFLRKEFLSVLDEGIRLGVSHPTFCDFREYLWDRENSVEAFRNTKVSEWPKGSERWIGFFKELKIAKKDLAWSYVNNQSGGFWCAHWHWAKWNGQEVYLQIEEGKLCFKIATGRAANKSRVRDSWKDQVLKAVKTPNVLQLVRPNRLGHGTWMTAALVERDDWMTTDTQGLLDMKKTLLRLARAERLLSAAVASSSSSGASRKHRS